MHFAPCALFVTGVLALVRAGSFSGRSDWQAVPPGGPVSALGLTATVTACAALLGLLLQPFQVRAVRVLRRWKSLRRRADRTAEKGAEIRMRADAGRRLAARPR
ncbi:hypothetical protein [Streptomyces canus]|uniref:hypothetical protein n=1 Tax=Streptomyces canus TaxID=58343 RepID=UPI0027D8D190|nr:hypothetical protein [Streptomyces canus]